MNRIGRGLLAATFTALGLAAVAWVSAVPVRSHRGGTLLRLSFGARPERIEVCRTLSAEELAQRLEHMRQRVECEGRFATYALQVELDGVPIADLVVRGGGLRRDRPLHVLEEVGVPAGAHALRVRFARREAARQNTTEAASPPPVEPDTGLWAGRREREAAERGRRARAAIPPRLELDTSLIFVPGRVALVTFDTERRALVLRTRP